MSKNTNLLFLHIRRTYSWDKEHCETLWQDIEKIAQMRNKGSFYRLYLYIKMIFINQSSINKLGVYRWADKRLTGVTLLLEALREFT